MRWHSLTEACVTHLGKGACSWEPCQPLWPQACPFFGRIPATVATTMIQNVFCHDLGGGSNWRCRTYRARVHNQRSIVLRKARMPRLLLKHSFNLCQLPHISWNYLISFSRNLSQSYSQKPCLKSAQPYISIWRNHINDMLHPQSRSWSQWRCSTHKIHSRHRWPQDANASSRYMSLIWFNIHFQHLMVPTVLTEGLPPVVHSEVVGITI